MAKGRRAKEKILVATNLKGREEVVAEKLGTAISPMIPTVVNRFIQRDTYNLVLTSVKERNKIYVEAG